MPENLPRCLGKNQAIKINLNSWSIPPIFEWLAEVGSVSPQAMYNTFNMGIGFVLLVPPDRAAETIDWFANREESAWAIGEVISGSGELQFVT